MDSQLDTDNAKTGSVTAPNQICIAAILTCHNRKNTTLACLFALVAQKLPSSVTVDIYLVDDGSTDGTSIAVRKTFPQARVLNGSGMLYWSGGMRIAYDEAMKGNYDFYLWLNDDTLLDPDAVSNLLKGYGDMSRENDNRAIIVGSTREPETGCLSYGGSVRVNRWHPLKFAPVVPKQNPQPCDTFCGNCVLISHRAAKRLGNLDPTFIHHMGDTDYGLRARKADIPVWVASGFVGVCAPNALGHFHRDATRPLAKRLSWLFGVKCLPLREWMTFTRRHAGPMWWIFFMLPYARLLAEILLADIRHLMNARKHDGPA